MITGLVLHDDGPRIPKSYLRKVRAMIHNAEKLIGNGNKPKNLDEIKGKLSFIKMVMPEYAEKTMKKHAWLGSDGEPISQMEGR
tara:strand:- start:380 stop:631 length:252 start_codon:yes stop_codon:yes gene_type:complete